MGFFTILGIIAFFFLCKFLYDTYLSNNTDKNWHKLQSNYPDLATKVDSNRNLKVISPTLTDEEGKILSYALLAEQFDCNPDNVKKSYILELRNNIDSLNDFKIIIINLKERKLEEAKQLNVNSDCTPSALLLKWTQAELDYRLANNYDRQEQDNGEDKSDENEGFDDEDDDNENEDEMRTFTFAVHKVYSERIQPGLDSPKFCGVVG